MKRKFFLFGGLALTALLTIRGVQYSSAPPAGTTGAPGEGNCTGCHAGNPLNGGGGSVQIGLTDAQGNPLSGYIPGQTHNVTVYATHPNFTRFGFSTTALTSDNNAAGNFPNPGMGMGVQTANGRQYVGHTSSGTNSPVAGEMTWTFPWQAPATDVGNLTFYVCVNAVNGNGNTVGDFVYTASRTFAAFVPPPTIAVLPLNDDKLCAGKFVSIEFTVSGGSFGADNVFSAELSAPNGAFDNPTVIGSEPGTTSGNIGATVPLNIAPGTGYKIRIRASSPAAVSQPGVQNLRSVPPPVVNWPPTLNLCAGATVNLPAPNLPGAQYVWVRDGQSLPETGPVLTADQPGVYSLSLTDECGATVEASVTVVEVEPQIPSISRTGNTLTSSAAQSYQWYFNGTAIQGATQVSFEATESGIYTVQIVDANGCTATSEPFDFVFDPNAGPSISTQYTGGDVCAGSDIIVEFTASGSFGAGNQFRLELSNENGEFSTPTTLATQAGLGAFNAALPKTTPAGTGYRLRVNATDPVVVGTATASFTVFAAAPEVEIVRQGAALTVSPEPTGATLTWQLDGALYQGPLDGTQPEGTYTVVVVTADGCRFESEPYVFSLSSIEEFWNNAVSVYPNPAGRQMYIEFPFVSSWNVNLYDLTGKVVPFFIKDGVIDVSTLDDGVYVLKMASGGREYRRKVVVKR